MATYFNSITLAIFFLSGFIGLCYEICWIRSASQIFGSTNFAVSSVVALFFTGMAMGASYFGRHATRYTEPLKVYARIEIGIGLFAVSSPYLLSFLELPYQWLYVSYYQNSMAIGIIRLLLVAMIIVPPTFLMGGTLPLFTQFQELSGRATPDRIAFLYALNTVGAAVGCLVCGFLFVPHLGINKTLLGIGILAQASGLLILFVTRNSKQLQTDSYRPTATAMNEQIYFTDYADRVLLYGIIFGTGFCALSYEILWTRFLSLITHNTVYTYTMSLLIALLGIAAGSYLAQFRNQSVTHVATLGVI